MVEIQDSRATLIDSGPFVSNKHVNVHDIQRLHLTLASKDFLGAGLGTEFDVGLA